MRSCVTADKNYAHPGHSVADESVPDFSMSLNIVFTQEEV